MGRVYKALAKSWKEQANPSESREPEKNATPQAEASPLRRDEAPDEGRDERRDEVVYGLGMVRQERLVVFTNHPASADFNLDEELPMLRDAAIARESPINDWSYEPRRLQVAPAPIPAAVFVQPKTTMAVNPATIEPHLVALNGNDALAAERYRTLAVRLLNLASRPEKKLKTLLITSARQSEGKTTVAINLAWVMAKPQERRVLLIDANVQNSALCQRLALKPSSGWLDVIEERVQFVDAAIRLDPNGLYVMAARTFNNGAATADELTSSRVEKLFTELEQHFDFILIDAPPIVDSADAQRIASIVDGTVMVSRAGHTHHTAVTEALKLVPKERRLGVVLNEAQSAEAVSGKKPKRAKAN
ncbi:MAG: CpsD/CapB family tyrosine-protein kinase [Acidobacteria bacterium]|nr:CpsD/CapB family tyrosine-protein kinase [Acidobacteriota bacterium]